MARLFIAFCLFCTSAIAATAQPVEPDWLQAEVDATRQESGLFALGAAVAVVGEDPVIAVSGQTAKGSETAAAPDDAWHIGSNTKALTALLYARLVEDGLAEWGATLPELFPAMADEMDPAWQDTRIEDLFAHRSGVGDIGALWLMGRRGNDAPLTEQRRETTRNRLTKAPKGEPGTFEYSNLNYIVAGAAIERLLELSWEKAITGYVLEANGADWSEGWGFGPPQEGIQGHRRGLFGNNSAAGRGGRADNPQALGPAGTLHVPLESHARLLLEFVDEDSDFITPSMRDHLLSPWPDEAADYAMGWAVQDDETLGRVYLHNGSNTMWLSRVVFVPSRDAVIIVNTSEFSDTAKETTQALLDALKEQLAETGE
ncbi:serine hydrolase domain-containing protein [Henriciella sp.]|uniref:serine hydrolase domain-containing protein n=1 Tax=Henriciella sp. TaxID=1968823 RepID=UPI00262BE724|nr:serine hydrolase domain-containing protein [Henriciella sp.]